MENTEEKAVKTAPRLPPPLPPLETTGGKIVPMVSKKTDPLKEKQKYVRRVVGCAVGGIMLVIIAGAGISKLVQSPDKAVSQLSVAPPVANIISDSASYTKENTEEQETLENGNELAWQAVLSPQFKSYRENDDVPGQIERYKDDLGHRLITEAWSRNIQSDDKDTSITEALVMVFGEHQEVVRTKDTLFVSTGILELVNHENEYYYIVYCPKFMQSYSLYSRQADTLFATYSEKLIEAVRAMKSSN